MLELIFQGFTEWIYGMILECWQFFTSAMLDIMRLDFDYLRSHIPVIDDIMQVVLAVGWALLIGNLVFQAVKSMVSGLGFEGEDPKLLFTRTFVFSFLLLASPQICRIGLNMTSAIIDVLQIPDAIDVHLVDDSIFGELTAAWLLVIVFDVILMFKVLKLLIEIAERYVILAVLTITAPLAFATGGSRNTSDIFTGWCRMFGSMCLLMCTNIIFFKMLLSVVSTIPSGMDVFAWFILALAIVKVAKKADAIITRIGLNPAITGDGLGSRLPGMLAYTMIRTATANVVKSIGKSGGSTPKGASGNPPGGSGPKTAATVGGVSAARTSAETARNGAGSANTSASSSTHTQQSDSTAANTQTNTVSQSAQASAATAQSSSTQQQTAAERSVGVNAVKGNQERPNTQNARQKAHRTSVPAGTKRGVSYTAARAKHTAEKSTATAGKQPAAPADAPEKTVRDGGSTRFSHVASQRTQDGSVNSAAHTREQSGVTIGQTNNGTSANPGTAGTASGVHTASDRTETRATQRSHATHTAATTTQTAAPQPGTAGTPAAAAPAPKPSSQPEARHSRNTASVAEAAPVIRSPSAPARQEQRVSKPANTPQAKPERSAPAPQEAHPRPVSGTPAQRSTASTRRPGTAGTAEKAPRAAQTGQTAKRQSPRATPAPTAGNTMNGKKAAPGKKQAVKQAPQRSSKAKGDDGHG